MLTITWLLGAVPPLACTSATKAPSSSAVLGVSGSSRHLGLEVRLEARRERRDEKNASAKANHQLRTESCGANGNRCREA